MRAIVVAFTQRDSIVPFSRAVEHNGGGALPGYVS